MQRFGFNHRPSESTFTSVHRSPSRFSPGFILWVLMGIGALALFHFWGNSTRGYIPTPSLFVWWMRQWFLPAAELQHGPLVLAGAVWLAWRNLRRGPACRAGSWVGAGVVILSLLIHVVGYQLQAPRLSWFAGAAFFLGWVELGMGLPRAKALLLPLAFLTLSLSWGFLDTFGLGFHLRLGVTAVVERLVNAFDVQVVREGTNLIPVSGGMAFEVAAACAGLRSLTAVLATAVLLAQLQLRGFWSHLILLVSAAGIVWLGNVVRVALLVILGLRYGVERAQAWHDRWGFLVFIAELGVVAWLAWRLRVKGEEEPPTRATGQWVFMASLPVLGSALFALASALAWLGLASTLPTLTPAGIRLDANGAGPAALPAMLEGRWGSREVLLSRMEAEVMPADTRVVRRAYYHLARPDTQILVTVVLAGADRTSIHRPELCLTGSGWSVEGRRTLLDADTDLPALLLTLRRQGGVESAPKEALMLYWFVGREGPVASYPGMLWRAARERLGGKGSRWSYFAVQMLVDDQSDPRALADAWEVGRAVYRALGNGEAVDSASPGFVR